MTTFDARELQTLLSTDASRFDFFVTGKEAKSALAKLEALAPADFYAAMQSLSKGGQLETLLDKLPWEDQCRFLSMAADKGSIERTPAEPGKGPLNPPGQPALLHMSLDFPRCLNDLIHEHSKAQYGEFKREYDAYKERYQEALGQCGSLLEIQRLGRPASVGVTREYVPVDDPYAGHYGGDWPAHRDVSQQDAYLAVSDRMADLTGEKRDGATWFEFKLERSTKHLTDETTGRLGVGESKLETKVGVVMGDAVGPAKFKVKGYSDGTESLAVDWKGAEASVSVKEGHYKKSSFKAGPVKVIHEKGGGGVELTPIKVETGGVKAEAGSWSAGSTKERELRGGIRGGVKVEDVEVKLQVGFGVRSLREQTVARALSNSHDVFAVAPELDSRTPWSALPPERRQALEKFGWNDTQWATALSGGES